MTDGYIHMFGAEQVAHAAERNFSAREDLLVLVVDRARVRDELRGEPGGPESMHFPRLFGPLPVAALTSVMPYRPGPEGVFVSPVGIPPVDDALARATAFERSVAERRAAVVLPVDGGVACIDPRVRSSWEHNA